MFGWFINWFRYRKIVNQINRYVVKDISVIGSVHVKPMDPGMRHAFYESIREEGVDTTPISLWIISHCVKEFQGRNAAKLGMDLRNLNVVGELVNAVLDVSGMTKQSQAANEKKSQKTGK